MRRETDDNNIYMYIRSGVGTLGWNVRKSGKGWDRLRYDIRAVVLTPRYEIARFKGTLSGGTCIRYRWRECTRTCAYLSMYYEETWAWNTHPSKSRRVAPWKLTVGNTKGRLTSERYRDKPRCVGYVYASVTMSPPLPLCIRGWMVRWLDSVTLRFKHRITDERNFCFSNFSLPPEIVFAKPTFLIVILHPPSFRERASSR